MKKRKQWIGSPPTECDLCHAPISNVFVDACLFLQGQRIWGNVCKTCHQEYGVGLGEGKGQEYWLDEETGKFLKIEG